MATLNELALQYANRIKSASRRDAIQINEDTSRKASILRRGSVVAELRKIQSEINALVYESNQQKLSEADKATILNEIARIVGESSSSFQITIKCASADQSGEVVAEIERIIGNNSSGK